MAATRRSRECKHGPLSRAGAGGIEREGLHHPQGQCAQDCNGEVSQDRADCIRPLQAGAHKLMGFYMELGFNTRR